MSSTPPQHRGIPSLDGLRAVSILLVVVSHGINALGYEDPAALGFLGVRVFFVISGFLITGLLLKELDATNTVNLLAFYFRRTLRIFPPFYFFLLVMLLLATAGWVNIPFASFVPAFSYVSNYISTGSPQLIHSWSLSVEEQFYLLWPGVLVLCGRRRAFLALCLVVVASPVIRVLSYHLAGVPEPVWLAYGFHTNMDALALGCLLAFARARLHANGYYRRLLNSKIVLAFPLVILWANVQVEHPHLYQGACVSMMNVLSAFLVDWAVTNHRGAAGRLLNSRPLATVGVMSYSIYLWQQPFLLPGSVHTGAQLAVVLMGIAAASTFSYLVVERLSLALRKKLQRGYSRRRGAIIANARGC